MGLQAKYIAMLKAELAAANGRDGEMQPTKQKLYALSIKEQASRPKYTGPPCQIPGCKNVTSHRTQDCRSMLKCDRCDRTGHTADRCNTIGLTCLLCNSADHLIAKCPGRHLMSKKRPWTASTQTHSPTAPVTTTTTSAEDQGVAYVTS